jgi:single-stranded DNA-binding protein
VNTINLIGRLTRDPESRSTGQGKAVAATLDDLTLIRRVS